MFGLLKKRQRRQMAVQRTSKTSEIDRRLAAAREAMGDKYLGGRNVERDGPKPSTAQLHHRWDQFNKLERGVA